MFVPILLTYLKYIIKCARYLMSALFFTQWYIIQSIVGETYETNVLCQILLNIPPTNTLLYVFTGETDMV